MTDSPMDFFGHRETKEKQKIVALSAPIAQEIDDLPLSEGYSASEAFDDSEEKQRQDVVEVQAWEDAGLEHYAETSEQGGVFRSGDTEVKCSRIWKFHAFPQASFFNSSLQ